MAANETPGKMKISWNPGKGREWLQRSDGARYTVGTGRKGTYEWVMKDGLHAAYHYPCGAQTRTPVVLVPPQSSAGVAYHACVEHNKAEARWEREATRTAEIPRRQFQQRADLAKNELNKLRRDYSRREMQSPGDGGGDGDRTNNPRGCVRDPLMELLGDE